MPAQPRNKHLHIVTDNAGNQCKNVYQFSWMVDYVNEDHGLDTIQHNFSCEAHGKGIHDAEGDVYFNNHFHLLAAMASHTTLCYWCFRW